jgi:hypothetical protein
MLDLALGMTCPALLRAQELAVWENCRWSLARTEKERQTRTENRSTKTQTEPRGQCSSTGTALEGVDASSLVEKERHRRRLDSVGVE